MPVKDSVFFDTNVLVYQFDKTAPRKQKRAVELIERYGFDGKAVISTQVAQEFMNVALRGFAVKLSPAELELVIDDLLKPLCAHSPNFDFYKQALKLCATNSINFYDALIVQAALDCGCVRLYSEDMQDGQQFGSLTIVNPFV
ncbi:MAG TPA: PIN domain-containing protein [Candidatus Binatia bacterium]|nr:PIN domain-containing protein [Candidatus Binatia bacterium]